MSDTSRAFGRFVVRGLWFPLVLAGAAVMLAVYVDLNRPSSYVSRAKLVGTPANGSRPEYLADFYGTIIETLESNQLHKHALQRVRLLFPDLKETATEARVTRHRNSGTLNVAVTGTDPVYCQTFLNALLDEFKAVREMIKEQQRNKAVQAIAEDVVKAGKTAKDVADKLEAFNKTCNVALLKARQTEQSASLQVMLAERRSLSLALERSQQSKSGAAEMDKTPPVPPANPGADQEKWTQYLAAQRDYELRGAMQKAGAVRDKNAAARLAILDKEVNGLEKELTESSSQVQAYERLQKEADSATAVQKELFDFMHKFTVSEAIQGDSVNVMERASPATDEHDIEMAMVMCGGVAFIGGIILLLLCGAFRAASAPPTRLPPALPADVA